MATPPITGPTKTNLDIAMQLAATMSQISEQLSQQTDAYQRQVELVEALCKAQECFGNIDPSKIKDISNALKVAHGDSEKFGKSITKTTELTGKLGEALEKAAAWAKNLSVPAEFINGFKSGLAISGQMFSGIMSLGASAFELMKNIGGIILSMPGRIIDFFASKSGGGGTDEYRQGLEEVRKEFGNLEVGTSAAIINMTKSMKDFGESGVSFGRVFGHGRAGMATLLKENLELAKEMGSNFRSLAASIGTNSREFTILRKATGMTGVEAGALQLQAESTGQSLGNMVKSMSIKLAQAEQTFNISTKEFGRDINAMLKETATFGQVAPDVMIKTSAYVKKLGISIETLKKTMDASFTFEDAAQQAATLSEAFGMNIDSMKLFSETDPTKKLDQIRQSFFQAGKSVESLNIHEMKALSNATHLSDEELRRSFAMKNRGVSQASLNEQMKKGQKTEMTQQEAMVTLAKSIERLTNSGGGAGGGGFLDHFLKGFERGIERSRIFKTIVHNLERAFRVVEYAGREVGRMFLDMFPGMQDIMHGLADMFNPDRFRVLMRKVVDAFRDFFSLLQTDPAAGFSNFMTRLKTIFLDFFTAGSPAGSRFLSGMKDFFKTIGIIFIQGLKYALESVGELMTGIIDYMKNPASLNVAAAGAGEGLKGMFLQALKYAVVQLKPALSGIGTIFVSLLKELYEKYIQPHLTQIILGALAFFLGPAIVIGFVRGTMAVLLGQGIPAIVGMIRKLKPPAPLPTPEAGPPPTPDTAAEKVMKSIAGMRKMAAAVILFTVAAAAVIGAIILLAAMAQHFKTDPVMLLTLTGILGAVAALFFGLIKLKFFEAVAAFGKAITWKDVGNAMLGLLAVGLLVVAIAAMLGAALLFLAGVDKQKMDMVLGAIGTFTILMVGLSVVLGVLALVGYAIGQSAGAALPLIIIGFVAVAALLAAIVSLAVGSISAFAAGMQTANINDATVKTIAEVLKSFTELIVQVSGALANLTAGGVAGVIGSIVGLVTGTKSPVEQMKLIIESISVAINALIPILNAMTGDPAVLGAKAAVFSTIASGLGALMGPIISLMDNISDDFFAAGSADAAKDAGKVIIDVIKALMDKDTGVIPPMLEKIKQFASDTSVDPARLTVAANVFAVVAKGLAEIIGAVTEFMKTFDSGFVISPIQLLGNAVSTIAKIGAMNEMVQSLLPAITTAVGAIMTEIVAVSSRITNIEALKALGPILESVSNLIVGMLKAITEFTGGGGGVSGIASAVGDATSGRTSADLTADKLISLGTFIGTLTGSIRRLLIGPDGKSGIIGAITTLTAAVPSDANKVKGLAVVADILKSVTGVIVPIITAVTGMTGQIPTGSGVSAARITAMGNQISGIIGSVTTSFSAMFAALPALVTSLASIRIPPSLGANVKSLSAVFELMKTLATITVGFSIPTGGGATRQANMWSDVVVPILQTLAYFVVEQGVSVPGVPHSIGHRESFMTVLTALSTVVFPAGLTGKIAVLKSIFESIKVIAEATTAIKGIGGTAGETTTMLPVNTLEIPLTNLARIIGGITSNEATAGVPNPLMHPESFNSFATIRANIHGKGPIIEAVKTSFESITTALNSLASLAAPTTPEMATAIWRSLAAQNSIIHAMDVNFGDTASATEISNKISAIKTNLRGGLVVGLSSMVSAYQDFTRDLRVLSELPTIETTLETVGVRLQARNLQRIERGAVNVQLNVNIKLEAAQVTQALYNFRNSKTSKDPGDWSENAFIPSPASTTNN